MYQRASLASEVCLMQSSLFIFSWTRRLQIADQITQASAMYVAATKQSGDGQWCAGPWALLLVY